MFTGLVTDVGEIESAERSEDGVRLRVGTALGSEISAGDSVAVGGVCLTATEATNGSFAADVSPQTLEVSTLGSLEVGQGVNLELALRLSDRLGGHLVQGHVDGTGQIAEARDEGGGRRLRVAASPELMRYVVERGSIAVDGVSLTVAALDGESFEVALVPETLARTTLGELEAGRPVNLECDLLARYIERLASGIDHHSQEVDPRER